jgi:hypothetical protein
VLLFARSRHRRFDGLRWTDVEGAVRVERRMGAVRPRRRQIINARLADSHTTHAIFSVIENEAICMSRGIVCLRYFSHVKVDDRE